MKAKINISGYIGALPLQAGETEANAVPRFTFTQLASAVKKAREDGATEFEFLIDSFGGYVNEGFLIAEYIESLKEPTTTIAIQVHSIANVIFFAGDTRKGEPMSLFMLHSALVETGGNAEHLRDVADMLDKETDRIASYIAMRSGLDFQALKGLMGDDRFIEHEEAEKLGFYGSSKRVPVAAFTAQDAWGSTSGVDWAIKKVESLENKNPTNMKEEQKEKLTAWQQLGQKLGFVNMEAPEKKEENMEGEEEEVMDKDKEIESLKATIADLKAQLQAMQEKEQAMQEEKKEFEDLSTQVSAVLKELDEAKKRTSNANPPSSHQRFNQTKGKPAPTGAESSTLPINNHEALAMWQRGELTAKEYEARLLGK